MISPQVINIFHVLRNSWGKCQQHSLFFPNISKLNNLKKKFHRVLHKSSIKIKIVYDRFDFEKFLIKDKFFVQLWVFSYSNSFEIKTFYHPIVEFQYSSIYHLDVICILDIKITQYTKIARQIYFHLSCNLITAMILIGLINGKWVEDIMKNQGSVLFLLMKKKNVSR